MSATDLQSLLRFLSQDAKVPLVSAMSKVKELQSANLNTPENISKAKVEHLKSIFPDEKVSKQILTAAKRVTKKRAAGEDTSTMSSPANKKAKRDGSFFSSDAATSEDLEASLQLPTSTADIDELSKTVLFTNRAPLALAFVFTLLKYSMPEQPLSSRLSLAQGYISITSRARAVYLGIESGKSAEEEGWGEGTPGVFVTGKEIKVLRRWGYEWKAPKTVEAGSGEGALEGAQEGRDGGDDGGDGEDQPALWALDLEALKKSNNSDPVVASAPTQSGSKSTLPIYTPQSARAYLLKAFDTASTSTEEDKPKKSTSAAKAAEKERNLGKLLRALDLLYESWSSTLSPEDLDKRTWGWYVKVRPDVADGVAGWGGKNNLKLADILALRRTTTT